MFEYAAFNPYNSSPEALATELTKKSAEGWEVVSIVPTTDGRYCAFLRKSINSTNSATASHNTNANTLSSSNTNSEVPAAWYADPSNRFELRYWNGKEWTEHVAKSGQQFTDPPVA
ncbi:MAG: DUF2510 domain-containing protein [Actinomycetota bacterium]|jgi:Protein of unknown function (DUF2510)